MKNFLSVLSSTLQGGIRGGLLILTLLATTSLWAYDFQSGDLYYNITSDSTVAVTYQKYNSSSNYASIYTVTVPETITYDGTTYSVTSIGNYAFRNCSSLTSVTIGESVTSIGEEAFYGCSSLTSITIPNSVTSIGRVAFFDCSSLTSVTIPNSVTSIGPGAFVGCTSITKTNYTGNIASWCDISFGNEFANPIYYSKNLYIDEQEVKDLVIPNTVNSIRDYTFSYCSSLTSITIPNSVTSIGDEAFRSCSSLTSITIPESVTSIGSSTFIGCYFLKENFINNSSLDAEANNYWDATFVDTEIDGLLIRDNTIIRCRPYVISATIPDNVTSIGDYAFSGHSSLTSVTIPNSVTSIGNYAFQYCRSLISVTIPNSVTSIGNRTFCGCDALTSMVVESGNATYDSRENCNAIIETATNKLVAGCQNTIIPNSVTSIGNYAFYGCSSLTSVTIPNSVTWIGYEAFRDCSSLTSVTIPNSVTSIGSSVFRNCSSLTSVTIGKSVKSIGEDAFYKCSSLTFVAINSNAIVSKSYSYDSNISHIFGSKVTEYIIGDDVKGIGDYAFKNCYSLTSVTIPNSVTSIGSHAFEGCPSLTSMTIPYSVTSIGNYAFAYCTSLTSVTIPESVTSIGKDAFKDCSSLTFVAINSNAIVSKSYSYDSNISHIFGSQVTEYIIGDDVKGIGDYAFYTCSSLTSVTIPNSVTSIGDYAFGGCSSLTSMTIPNSVTSIEDYAFYYCYSLTSVTIPESVTSIGDYAFGGCYSLTSVIIPNSVTSIGDDAFRGCESLTSVTIPESVTSIGDYAFNWCSSLTSVTIGKSVKSIGENAFYNCVSLTKTNYTGDIAGWCNIDFYGGNANPMCYSHNFYINDQEIKDLVIPNSVTSIGSSAFNSCSSLTSVTIGESVTSIGHGAFYGCSALTSVTIPNSVTSIGSSVFRNCTSLTSVTIGESVTSIGERAFYDCSSLTSVTIGNSVTSIGDDAFRGCESLTSVTIPNSVTYIGWYAFEDCSSLTSVTIPNSVTSIGKSAFEGCSSLTSITCEAENPPTVGSNAFYNVSKSIPVYVPCGCIEAYKAANGWKDFTNIQGLLAEYSIEVNVNDTIMGSAKVDYNTFCEGNQISATPNLGYHFVQWNDGNTENPRTLELTQDTILTAEFAQSFFGQCGDNLYWSYDETAKTISITGSGKMYEYTADTQPWLLFKEQIVEVTTTNTVTSIGTSAFEGCARLGKISLGTGLEEIAANAFAGCTRLYDVYCYATNPPFAEQSSFANYNVYLYVPCESQRNYTLDVVWGNFKFIECIESEDVSTDGVVITPTTNDVTIIWPTEIGADTYTIVIKKGDTVFCTLTFNADGQLLNIAFAPGRDGNHPAQYAEQAGNGYRFTVTGLESGTKYGYNIDVKDASNKTIKSHSGEFTTQSTTAVENTHSQSPTSDCQKILRNGQLLIFRDGVEYTIMGAEIK